MPIFVHFSGKNGRKKLNKASLDIQYIPGYSTIPGYSKPGV